MPLTKNIINLESVNQRAPSTTIKRRKSIVVNENRKEEELEFETDEDLDTDFLDDLTSLTKGVEKIWKTETPIVDKHGKERIAIKKRIFYTDGHVDIITKMKK